MKKLGKDHDQLVVCLKEAVEGRKTTPSSAEYHPERDEVRTIRCYI